MASLCKYANNVYITFCSFKWQESLSIVPNYIDVCTLCARRRYLLPENPTVQRGYFHQLKLLNSKNIQWSFFFYSGFGKELAFLKCLRQHKFKYLKRGFDVFILRNQLGSASVCVSQGSHLPDLIDAATAEVLGSPDTTVEIITFLS